MASTASPSLKLELMATGDQSGTWGDTTNTNLGTLLEQAITGNIQIAKTGTTDYTLTNTDYVSNENRNYLIEFTGTPGGSFNVIVPNAKKLWVFKNSTNGALTVKTSGGTTTVTIPVSSSKWVYCDGAAHIYDALGYFFTSASTAFSPTASDAQALGTTTNMWSDLFLASGGVVNWNNGDVTVTHGTNTLTFAGAASGYTFSDGGVVLGAATGGSQGAGTVNATGIYVNGTLFSGGATGGGSNKVFYLNDQSATTTYSIPSGQNAMSTGPITIGSGVTITVPSGSRWVVI